MDQEEKLIEMVRVHPVLYDTSHSKYMKSKYKQEIWGKIGKELNIADVEELKSMWKKLRNNHRDALRRQKRMMKSGAAATEIKPWRLQAQMEFLLKYMVNDNRETSFTNDDSNSELQQRELPETQQPEEIQEAENDITDIIDEMCQPDTAEVERSNSADLTVKERTRNMSPPPVRPPKKLKKNEVDIAIVKAIEHREQRAADRAKERKKLEEKIAPSVDLHLFFMSMYELTKKMPISSQHIVRRNVFLSVTDEEARLLNIHQEPSYSSQQPQYQVRQPMYEDRQFRNWSRSSNVMSPETSTSSSAVGHPSASTSPDGTLATTPLDSFMNAFNT